VAGTATAWEAVRAADEAKTPTIKEIMKKGHSGDSSLLGQLRAELKDDEPEWTDIQKQTKELVTLGTALGKNDPPRGEADSWKELTKKYLDNAKDLNKAANSKDKKAAKSALAKVQGSCMGCHKAHKPRKSP
jgi:cytochrome c556